VITVDNIWWAVEKETRRYVNCGIHVFWAISVLLTVRSRWESLRESREEPASSNEQHDEPTEQTMQLTDYIRATSQWSLRITQKASLTPL
jgi:hypothetical protein